MSLEDVRDQATKFVDISFFNEDGDPVVPMVVTWSLYDGVGDVVNEKQGVEITPAAVVQIILRGDDLVYRGNTALDKRRIDVHGTYMHSSGELPLHQCETFSVIKACS